MFDTLNTPTRTVGEELRTLEHQVDAIVERTELPQTMRIVLRSVASLLMAARHLWEDEAP